MRLPAKMFRFAFARSIGAERALRIIMVNIYVMRVT